MVAVMLTIVQAWSPVILLAVLAIVFRRGALTLAVAGYLWTCLLAFAAFTTPVKMILMATLDGVLTTLPLLLVVYGGILLASVLIEAGSLKRLAEWFTGAVGDEWQRVSLLAMGMGNALEGAGIIAEPVAAPMLRASGLAPAAAAALSIVGYSGLMTLGLGGVIVTVLANVTGFPTEALVGRIGALSVPAAVLMSCSVPWILGRGRELAGKLIFLTVMGLVSGLAAWGAVIVIGHQVGEFAGGVVLTMVLVLPGVRRLKPNGTILKDMVPFLIMGCGITAVNMVPFLREWTGDKLAFSLSVIQGRDIVFRPLSDAYFYLFAAFVAAHWMMMRGKGLGKSLIKGTVQGWRPLGAMALFGAMGQVLAFTGASPASPGLVDAARHVPSILAMSMAGAGPVYPVFVPLLGWVGTFLTGYGVASIMLFAALQMGIAAGLGVSPEVLVTGLAVGASVGGISSPFKVAFAASMSGATGMEGDILRKTIPLGIVSCLVLGVFLLFMV
jgi:lactate permease